MNTLRWTRRQVKRCWLEIALFNEHVEMQHFQKRKVTVCSLIYNVLFIFCELFSCQRPALCIMFDETLKLLHCLGQELCVSVWIEFKELVWWLVELWRWSILLCIVHVHRDNCGWQFSLYFVTSYLNRRVCLVGMPFFLTRFHSDPIPLSSLRTNARTHARGASKVVWKAIQYKYTWIPTRRQHINNM